jgi:hypothetical protein
MSGTLLRVALVAFHRGLEVCKRVSFMLINKKLCSNRGGYSNLNFFSCDENHCLKDELLRIMEPQSTPIALVVAPSSQGGGRQVAVEIARLYLGDVQIQSPTRRRDGGRPEGATWQPPILRRLWTGKRAL